MWPDKGARQGLLLRLRKLQFARKDRSAQPGVVV